MLKKSHIKSSGFHAPKKVVSNEEFSKWVDTSDEWIRERTGIKSRHIIEKVGETSTVDMAELAARQALENGSVSPEELDMILVGTVTPDYRLPSAACLLQERLGAKKACAMDIVAACAGSLYGLCIAQQFISTKAKKNVLVVGAETLSTLVNWEDRNTSVLFGDGASAAVIQPSPTDNVGFKDFELNSDGSHWKDIWVPEGGSRHPTDENTFNTKGDRVQMDGRETFRFAVKTLTEAAKQILDKHHLHISDISCVVSHQANLRIIEAVAKRLKIPTDRFVVNIDRYANTSSASLLTTYHEGATSGRFKKGDLILMMAIGAGFAWGTALYQF